MILTNHKCFLIEESGVELFQGVSQAAQYLFPVLVDPQSHHSWTNEELICHIEQNYTASSSLHRNIFNLCAVSSPGENGTPGNDTRLEAEDPHNALFPRDWGTSSHWLPVQILPGSWPVNCVAICWPLTPLCLWPVWQMFPFTVNTHLTLTYLWLRLLFSIKALLSLS